MSLRPRVLIVEDDPQLLLLLRSNLELAGCDTSLAADGITALRRIEAHPLVKPVLAAHWD